MISGLSDGWRFEQLLMNNPNPNTGAASEFYCVVSSDSANYCGTISHKAKVGFERSPGALQHRTHGRVRQKFVVFEIR